MHKTCIDSVRKSVEESKARHIVDFTHHLPTLLVVAPYYKDLVVIIDVYCDVLWKMQGSKKINKT